MNQPYQYPHCDHCELLEEGCLERRGNRLHESPCPEDACPGQLRIGEELE